MLRHQTFMDPSAISGDILGSRGLNPYQHHHCSCQLCWRTPK